MDDTNTSTTAPAADADSIRIEALKLERKGLRRKLKKADLPETKQSIVKQIEKIKYQLHMYSLRQRPAEEQQAVAEKRRLASRSYQAKKMMKHQGDETQQVSIVQAQKRDVDTHRQTYKDCHCSDHNPYNIVAIMLHIPA